MATTSVTTSTTSQYTITSGNELLVASGGNVTGATVQGGGLLVVSGGIESNAIISSGGTETVSTGSASGDQIYGVLANVSGVAGHLSNEIIESGGVFTETNSAVVSNTEVLSGGQYLINGNTSGVNSNATLVSGGFIELESAKATIAGTLTFSGGANTLDISATASSGYGVQAVIAGFTSGDAIDLATLASGTSLSLSETTSNGNTFVTVLSGGSTVSGDTFVFSGVTSYTSSTLSLASDSGGHAEIVYVSSGAPTGSTTSVTTSTGSGVYTETSGNTLLVLSGGSVSAATIASGGFLTISGGADTAAAVSSGAAETVSLGSATLDQIFGGATVVAGGTVTSETVQSGGSLFIGSGTIDSASIVLAHGSETVLGSATGDAIYGTLATVASTTGTLTSETVEAGGVFTLANGNVANAITVLSGGLFNISGADTGANNIVLSGGGALNLQSPKALIGGALTFSGGGNTLEVTSLTTTSSGSWGDQAVISGFSTSDRIDITVISAAGASLNVVSSGGNEVATVTSGGNSESFLFAGTSTYNAFTLSVTADTSGGAELVYNPNAVTLTISGGQTSSGLSVTSGETLTVQSGGTVSATNVLGGGSLIVSGADHTAAISVNGSETVYGSASGDQIAGAATIDGTAVGETVLSGGSLFVNGGLNSSATISTGATETVTNAGSATGDRIYGSAIVGSATVAGETVQSGGLLTVSSGGIDSATTILAGGNETVLGSATGDQVYGTQLVSFGTAVVTGETVHAGGNLDLFLKDAIASGTTVLSGGTLNISGNAYASNTVLDGGGVLELQSPKAEVTGSLTFASGGNTLAITAATSSGYGVSALISGFSSSDKIDMTSAAYVASALTLSLSVTSGNTVAEILSAGTAVETFTFSGTALSNSLALQADGNGGDDLLILPVSVTTSVTTSTAPGTYTEYATDTLLVLGGGSVSATTIDSGGFLTVNGGTDTSATVLAGGLETVSAGSATGDQIYGSANVRGGVVTGETVLSGGVLDVNSGASASNIVLTGSGTVDLAASTASLSGSLTFSGGHNTLEAGAIASSGYGDQAVISGFSSADKIDVTGISPTGATLSFASNGAGDAVATISGTGGSESFVFSNPATYNSGSMSLIGDGVGGVELILDTTPVVTFTSLGGETNDATQIVNGTVNTAVDPEAIGSTVSVKEGNTVVGTATVAANGYWSANVTLLNTDASNVLIAADTDVAGNTGVTSQSLTYAVNTAAAAFTPGNLVISISGDGDGSGSYGDNQASAITLEQITTTGTYVGSIVLPQTTTVVNGVTENAVSGEYGSSSEGTLELSADGHSLVIAGYGVNAATYNTGGAAVYGNAALAQSTSIQGGQYAAVSRVIADVDADGVIDSSTALFNVFNTNNPRSVATVNGTFFYITGQGVNGDTTQGLFYTTDGSSTATSINDATDLRVAEIYDGQLYVSVNTKQGGTGGTTNISDYGNLPTSATTPTVLTGLSNSVVLTSATANTVNTSDIGTSVNLSPENFFFANADTLYVADGGDPKEGGLGDGGLQKWTYGSGTWTLDYTLSQGLNLIPNTDSASSGDTGLIGLTGTVVGNSVELYATTEPLNDLGQTAVVAITDSLSATTGTGESFTTILTASADENIRGIAFVPSPYVPTITGTVAGQTTTSEAPVDPFSGVTITDANANAVETLTITVSGGGTLSGAGLNGSGSTYTLSGTSNAVTSALDTVVFTPVDGVPNTSVTTTFTLSDLSSVYGSAVVDSATSVIDTDPAGVAHSGQTLVVSSGQTSTGIAVLSGGTLDILSGGTASATTISNGGVDDVYGSASGTRISAGGLEFVSSGAVASGTVVLGGAEFVQSGGVGSGIRVSSGAAYVYGSAASATVLSGAFLTVSAGGVARATSVGNGGDLFVAGSALATSVGSGAVENVSSGGFDSGTSLFGAEVVSAGAVTSALAVGSGGGAFIYGSAASASVASSFLVVEAGGIARATSVGGGGDLFVAGSAFATSVGSGAVAYVSSGGVDSGTSVFGADVVSADAVTSALTVNAGGGALLYGSAVSASLTSSFLIVEAGGNARATNVGSGGSLFVAGSAFATSVGAGAVAYVSSGGFDSGTSVAGAEVVSSGGVASGTVISSGAGDFDYGSAASASVLSGAFLIVESGATAAAAMLSGGNLFVDGTASGTIVSSGSVDTVSSGGLATGTTLLANGVEVVSSGGVASGTVISSGAGGFDYGSVASASLQTGAFLIVESGGTAAAAMLSGGNLFVDGTASGTIVSSGAAFVLSGGVDSGATLSGGAEIVSSGGSANAMTLSSGAGALVAGSAVGANVLSGAYLYVSSGGGASATTVANGGSLQIAGTDSGTTLSGGAEIVSSGGVISGTVTFAGSGTLILTQASNFGAGALVAGFTAPSDVLDLRNIAFASAPTIGFVEAGNNQSGTLTVSGGGVTDTLTLIGTYTAGSFISGADGAGGTTIVDPPPATSQTLAPAHHA